MMGPDVPLMVIQDQRQPCPYLDQTARMPLGLPATKLLPRHVDQFLSLGYRRSGHFLYRTQCPDCDACKPTRVLVDRFRVTKSMKRVLVRGDRELELRVGPPTVDTSRVGLFNRHRQQRGLAQGCQAVDTDSYQSFLVASCCDAMEVSIYLADQLIAISIFDVGHDGISAVYTHFDQTFHRFSLGTYAILKLIQWAQRNRQQFVYLGMYVAENSHLNYKSRFRPQQRLIDGTWRDFGFAESNTVSKTGAAK